MKIIKTSELIQELQKLPPDKPVWIKYNVFYYEIDSVKLSDRGEEIEIILADEEEQPHLREFEDDEIYE